MPLIPFALNNRFPVSCRIKIPTRSVATSIQGGGVTVRPTNRQYIRSYSLSYELDQPDYLAFKTWLKDHEGKRVDFYLPGAGNYRLRTGKLTRAMNSTAITPGAKRIDIEVEVS